MRRCLLLLLLGIEVLNTPISSDIANDTNHSNSIAPSPSPIEVTFNFDALYQSFIFGDEAASFVFIPDDKIGIGRNTANQYCQVTFQSSLAPVSTKILDDKLTEWWKSTTVSEEYSNCWIGVSVHDGIWRLAGSDDLTAYTNNIEVSHSQHLTFWVSKNQINGNWIIHTNLQQSLACWWCGSQIADYSKVTVSFTIRVILPAMEEYIDKFLTLTESNHRTSKIQQALATQFNHSIQYIMVAEDLSENFNFDSKQASNFSYSNTTETTNTEQKRLRVLLSDANVDTTDLTMNYQIRFEFPLNDTKARFLQSEWNKPPDEKGKETNDKILLINTVGAALVSASQSDLSLHYQLSDSSWESKYVPGSDTPNSSGSGSGDGGGSGNGTGSGSPAPPSDDSSESEIEVFFNSLSSLQLALIIIVASLILIACCITCCQCCFYQNMMDKLLKFLTNSDNRKSTSNTNRGSGFNYPPPANNEKRETDAVQRAGQWDRLPHQDYDTKGYYDEQEYYYTDGQYEYEDDGKFYVENGIVYRDIDSDEEFVTLE